MDHYATIDIHCNGTHKLDGVVRDPSFVPKYYFQILTVHAELTVFFT
jgi:hypothetical protein